MSTPNINYSNLDARYSKPADISTAISAQATTDAGKYARLPASSVLGPITSTVNLDASAAVAWTATLTGNVTLNFINVPSGVLFTPQVIVTQDATGSRTVSFSQSGVMITPVWDTGVALSANTAPSSTTIFNLETLDGGVTWYGQGVQ